MVKQFGLPNYVIWLFAGTAFLIVGILSVLEWTFGVGTLLLTIAVAFIGYRLFFRPAFVALNILKSGQPAMAIILKVWETGVNIDHHPRIKMLLEIRPVAMVPYEVEIKQNIKKEDLKYYQPGRTLQVKIDSRDPKKIAIQAA